MEKGATIHSLDKSQMDDHSIFFFFFWCNNMTMLFWLALCQIFFSGFVSTFIHSSSLIIINGGRFFFSIDSNEIMMWCVHLNIELFLKIFFKKNRKPKTNDYDDGIYYYWFFFVRCVQSVQFLSVSSVSCHKLPIHLNHCQFLVSFGWFALALVFFLVWSG